MTVTRNLFGTLGALAAIYAGLALVSLPWLDFGLAVAISATCFIGWDYCRKERMRQERERVWRRRIEGAEASGLTVIRGGKDPDWLKHVGRMDMPPNGIRLRIGHDHITEAIIRDGEIVSERELPEVPERWPFADLKPWPISDNEASGRGIVGHIDRLKRTEER